MKRQSKLAKVIVSIILLGVAGWFATIAVVAFLFGGGGEPLFFQQIFFGGLCLIGVVIIWLPLKKRD